MIQSRRAITRLLAGNKYSYRKLQPGSPAARGLTQRMAIGISNDHKYRQLTSKQISKEIALQKWKEMQNTFKSLGSKFGTQLPTPEQIKNPAYMRPSKVEFTLGSLRQCSRSYKVYLYVELQKPDSPFNQLIDQVLDNLWKAEKKQTLQLLQFLHVWGYSKVDIVELYSRAVQSFELSMEELFDLLRRFEGRIFSSIELKILQRIKEKDLDSSQYSPLMRIVNLLSVKGLLREEFNLAIVRLIREKISAIPPKQVLQCYIYFAYNINEYGAMKPESESDSPAADILREIESRLLAPQCLKFYTGEQMVALLHTFLKSNLAVGGEYYQKCIDTLMGRVELIYFSEYFSSEDKQKLLQICTLLPTTKKQLVIALIQREYQKKKQKFDHNLLPVLYLVSQEQGMLNSELKDNLEQSIVENIFQMARTDIARILWIMTINSSPRLKSLMEKVETVLMGGLREFTLRDVSIVVWAMCAVDYKQGAQFWDNIQSFIGEELGRQKQRLQLDQSQNYSIEQIKQARKAISECCWVLWSYHNNRSLTLVTVDMVTQILLTTYAAVQGLQSQQKLRQDQQLQLLLTPFELSSIITFYYSLEFPSQSLLAQVKALCLRQFLQTYSSMQPIQLSKCLKYMGGQIWRDKEVAGNILGMLEVEVEGIAYRDLMGVVAVLMTSGMRGARVVRLIERLLERKKMLEAVTVEKQEPKSSGWKLPF